MCMRLFWAGHRRVFRRFSNSGAAAAHFSVFATSECRFLQSRSGQARQSLINGQRTRLSVKPRCGAALAIFLN
jgi:hypothetical protein